jgi:hypothetical protein
LYVYPRIPEERLANFSQIVDKQSATLNLPGTREKKLPIHADHSMICKFDPDNTECELVLGTIAAEIERALEIAQNS